jgi:hypothetical protein
MATRIDLDDTLAERLRALAKTRGISLREYITDLLHEALSKVSTQPPAMDRFQQRTYDFGVNVENPWAVLVEIETEEYMKLLAKK